MRAGAARQLSAEGTFVEKCVHLARHAKLREPLWWRVAQELEGWRRDQWDAAYLRYQFEQRQHCCAADPVLAEEGFHR